MSHAGGQPGGGLGIDVVRRLEPDEAPARQRFLPADIGDLTVDIVTDPAALPEVFAARLSAYVACGFIDPADYPSGIEFDEFEAVSVHFVARERSTGTLAGYTRLILDTWGRLQADSLVDISDYRSAHPRSLCEMSRLIAVPEGRRYAGRAVRWAACRWAQEHGIEQIVGVSLERDRATFERRRFVPMQPYRRCTYAGSRFGPLRGVAMYGNIFDVAANADYIRALKD